MVLTCPEVQASTKNPSQVFFRYDFFGFSNFTTTSEAKLNAEASSTIKGQNQNILTARGKQKVNVTCQQRQERQAAGLQGTHKGCSGGNVIHFLFGRCRLDITFQGITKYDSRTRRRSVEFRAPTQTFVSVTRPCQLDQGFYFCPCDQ